MEETNINELLLVAESYKNPNLLSRLFYNKNYLLQKAYEYYTQAINILVYKKNINKAIEIYPTVIGIVVDMNISSTQLAEEYCKFAEIIYLKNKEDSIKTYDCAIYCYNSVNNIDAMKEILLKIIKICEDLNLYNKLIDYSEKYLNNYYDENIAIILGNYYIKNDKILKAYNIFKELYNKIKNKESYLKYYLCSMCLNLEKSSDLLYPPLDFFEEIIFIEEILAGNIANLKHEDNIVNILLNILIQNIKCT